MMHSGTLLSKAEYSLMDRWFQFASEYYKKYVQPDVIGKQTYSRVFLLRQIWIVKYYVIYSVK